MSGSRSKVPPTSPSSFLPFMEWSPTEGQLPPYCVSKAKVVNIDSSSILCEKVCVMQNLHAWGMVRLSLLLHPRPCSGSCVGQAAGRHCQTEGHCKLQNPTKGMKIVALISQVFPLTFCSQLQGSKLASISTNSSVSVSAFIAEIQKGKRAGMHSEGA